MTDSLRNYDEALEWFQKESQKSFGSAPTPTGNWGGYCQMDSRMSYGIPPLFGSAWAQWLGADDEDKHHGTDTSKAPIGSALLFKGGSKGYGHIIIAARPFANDVPAAWSNDLVRYGMLDKVTRTATTEKWGQQYVGYITAINHVDLRLKEKKPAKPKQDKRYKGIDKAINRLEGALHTAVEQKDKADAKLLREEIARLKHMYEALRHA